jgi:hypothetical protein
MHLFRTWLSRASARRTTRAGRERSRACLAESLEQRTLLTTTTVSQPISDFGPSAASIYNSSASDGTYAYYYALTVGDSPSFAGTPGIARGLVRIDQNVDDFVNGFDPPAPGHTVFADVDGDGLLDPGEPSTVSAADGSYELTDIPVGTFFVKVAPQPGWYVSAPAAAGRTVVTSPDGGVFDLLPFGVTQTPPRNYISAAVFDDTNRDGIQQPGEPLVQGLVFLDLDDDGVLDTGEPSAMSSKTSGDAVFQPAGPGSYRVRYQCPSGWDATTEAPLVTLALGQRVFGLRLGAAVPQPSGATIAGTVFNDTDGDGTRDADETAAAGLRVYLDEDGDFALDPPEPWMQTDSLGRFVFPRLTPGNYSVRLELPAVVYQQTSPAPGEAIEVDVAAGEQRLDLSFGYRRGAAADLKTLAGRLFLDADANGRHDAGEGSYSGGRPRFYLDLDNNGQQGAEEPSSTTLADGTFQFSGVAPGRYRLRQNGTVVALRVSTFGADGSMIFEVPTVPEKVYPLEVGVYQPNALVTDAWFEGFQYPLRVRVNLADVSNPSGITSAVRVTGPDGAAVMPSSVFFGGVGLSVSFDSPLQPGQYALTIPGTALKGSAGLPTPLDYKFAFDYPPSPAVVKARHVFYYNSAFDAPRDPQYLPADDPANDNAIAPDKTALLPGGTATFANLTSFIGGINGIMIDVAGLARGVVLNSGDFEFRTGNTNDPAGWANAQPPAGFNTRRGAGVDGSDRITLVWYTGAVKDKWLQITLKAGARTGLAAPDVFYFGNLAGETGRGLSPARVDALDLARTRVARALNAAIDNPYDFNRDGAVNALDFVAVRRNVHHAIVLPRFPATTALSQATADPRRLHLDIPAAVLA